MVTWKCASLTRRVYKRCVYLEVYEFGKVWFLDEGLVYEGEDSTAHFTDTAQLPLMACLPQTQSTSNTHTHKNNNTHTNKQTNYDYS